MITQNNPSDQSRIEHKWVFFSDFCFYPMGENQECLESLGLMGFDRFYVVHANNKRLKM